ncbi:MAG: surface layer protein NpdA [Rhizobacter sp.]
MKRLCQPWGRRVFLLSALAACNLATAGVIQGTGSTPTATQLGATDAVRFQMVESGSGHLLVVPYFTAQAGQMSVLHLVNTDLVNGKAVKLRYRGAGNADTLLDMVVFLSPGDVWAGAVNAGADGKAQITTVDRSCTLPRIEPGQAQSFSVARLSPKWTSEVQANNTREGYVEAIVMADIPSRAVYGFKGSEKSMLFTAINHVAGVAPCTTSVIDAALLNDTSVEAVAASRGFATPTGGLTGKWYIIDVPGSTTFSGSATAFRAVNSSGNPARGNYVVFPQSTQSVTEPERFTADPLLVSAGLAGRSKTVDGVLDDLTTAPVLQAQFSDLPDLSTPYYLTASAWNARRTAGDLTQTMAVRSVMNEYATDESVAAKTDWVFSMPTKRYSVAVDHAATALSKARVYSSLPSSIGNAQHFSSNNLSIFSGGLVATSTNSVALDREGQTRSFFPMFMVGNSPYLIGAVSVISVNKNGSNQRTALNASVTVAPESFRLEQRGFNKWFENGRARVFVAYDEQPGLPILGASFIKLTNPAAQPGVSGNYGLTWPHTYDTR